MELEIYKLFGGKFLFDLYIGLHLISLLMIAIAFTFIAFKYLERR